MGVTTISATQWAYLGALDQALKTTDLATFDRAVVKNFTSVLRFQIADDDFVSFTPPNVDRYFFLITASSTQYYFGYNQYNVSFTLQNLGFTKLDGVLNGTTGVDENISIGVSNSILYIENRSGAALSFTITILGGLQS